MKKYDVEMALEALREARHAWREAKRGFDSNSVKVLDRLILEAAVNRMSLGQVSRYSGIAPGTIRKRMTELGMHGQMRKSKTLLAEHAAKALAENSDILGIAPHQMDLMSPLAYLPMGQELRQKITDATVSQVTELPEWDALADVIYEAMPWEGETYQAAAESIAAAVHRAGYAVSENSEVARLQGLVNYYENKYNEAHDVAPA